MNTKETSRIARERFEKEGKKAYHHEIIIWALKEFGPLTNWGIHKKSFYRAKDKQGNYQTYMLDYHQVARRTSELRSEGKIDYVYEGFKAISHEDTDGATRMLYRAVE